MEFTHSYLLVLEVLDIAGDVVKSVKRIFANVREEEESLLELPFDLRPTNARIVHPFVQALEFKSLFRLHT